jgi:geranylgeranyl pyrophosphate synthase
MTPDLGDLKAVIEAALARHLPEHSPIAPELVAAMRYATLTGGKRLRPMLVCAACTGVGGTLEQALAPACAVEFIHAYSLVHDDLPAMDDDELRHGVPSNHVRFGEATAILAGDALQALAFRTLATANGVAEPARLRALTLLADASGWSGMVGGQSFDLAAESRSLAQSELAALHGAKTGALIRAAVQIGAVVGNPALPDATFELLGEFAGRVGLAFQVIDDVLDVTASTEELGKQLLTEALDLHARAGLTHGLLAELARRSVHRAF